MTVRRARRRLERTPVAAFTCVAALFLVTSLLLELENASAARGAAAKSPSALVREARSAMRCLQSLQIDYVYKGVDGSDGSPMAVYRVSRRLVQVTNLDYYGDPSTEQWRISGRLDLYSSSAAARRAAKRDRRARRQGDVVALRRNGVLYLYHADNDSDIAQTTAAMLACISG